MRFPVPIEYDLPDVKYNNGKVITLPPALSGDGTGVNLSQLEKDLILTLFSKAAYLEDASAAYNALESLWSAATRSITYNLSNVSSSNTAESIESGQTYTTELTATEDYTINLVVVSMGGIDITDTAYADGTINIPSVTGDVVITASAVLAAQSITVTYTQSGTVYTTDSIDSLKGNLVVTATYTGGTTATVPSTDYTLSGTLIPGVSTITVNYAGLTDTFSVNAVAHGWYYTFNDTILSSGDHDFGFSGVQTYAEGVNGQAYYHHVATEGDSSTDPLGLYALQSADAPTWGSSDFTISGWQKCVTANRGHFFNAANYIGTTTLSWSGATLSVQDTNWSVYKESITKKYCGVRMGMWASGNHQSAPNITITNATNTNGAVFITEPPSSFDTTQWHHYALTRSGDTLYYFVDGTLIYTVTLPSGTEVYTSNYITVGNFMSESSANTVSQYPYSAYYDDLYVNVGTAKWTSAFDPYSITY